MWIKNQNALRFGKEHTALWRIMLDMDTIREANLLFDETLSLGEDTKFINTYFLYAKSVGILEKTMYYLTIRDGSANVTSSENPILMAQNKTKLISARKEIDTIAEEKGYYIHDYWQGTLVLSAMQLALRLSHNKKASFMENCKVYCDYINNPDVKLAIKDFSPKFALKALPFFLLKLHLSKVLYLLCFLLPDNMARRLK